MNTGKEDMNVVFHARASACFFSIYKAFENAISNVSRDNTEFRYQQLKKQYVSMLQEELELTAKHVLHSHQNERQLSEIDKMFHQQIREYLHRFIQKVDDR